MYKQELIAALKQSRQEFMKGIDGLSEDAMQKPGVVGEWSLKDLLAHLNLWEAELIKLLWQVQQGLKPSTAHFEKKNVDELSQVWQQENQERPLEMVLSDFRGIRNQTIRRVEAFQEIELSNARRYPWQKDRPLWKWIADDSFDHEAEHLEQVLSWRAKNSL
jgi:hypothetical protein